MELEKTIAINTKMLASGISYREVRSNLLDAYDAEKALMIATLSFKRFKKERLKSLSKHLFVYLLVMAFMYFLASANHPYKPKISYFVTFFFIIKVIYEWYNLRKMNREFRESNQ